MSQVNRKKMPQNGFWREVSSKKIRGIGCLEDKQNTTIELRFNVFYTVYYNYTISILVCEIPTLYSCCDSAMYSQYVVLLENVNIKVGLIWY